MKKLVALMMAATMAFSLAACGNSDGGGSSTTPAGGDGNTQQAQVPAEKQNVSLRMWGAEEDQTMLQGMIDSFIAEYADYANITVELGVESEADAKDDVLVDIGAAADVYAFASDQLNDLVAASALQSIDSMDQVLQTYAGKSVADVKSANAAGSVDAATLNGTLYAFPMSADNGYFLLYDSSVLSETDVQSWDSLLAAAGAANKKVGMVMASGWYNASFFYGAGFTTGLNEDGSTAMDWGGTSASGITGVQVVQGMIDITGNSAFLAVADGDTANQIASGSLCAIVSGTWDAEAAQKVWGDAYQATKLPTFTVNGKQVQQGSVAGFKLVAVNAQSANAGWATLLADWITNEENQNIRFEKREIGPSNVNAAASDAVTNNIAIAALAEQSAYGVVQVVGGNYWDPTATFGEKIAQGQLARDNETAIQEALDLLIAGVSQPTQ